MCSAVDRGGDNMMAEDESDDETSVMMCQRSELAGGESKEIFNSNVTQF